MTAQYSDKVMYRSQEYDLAGESGSTHVDSSARITEFDGLYFNPKSYGIELGRDRMSTACYRGYLCTYEIHNDELFLKDLRTIATPSGRLNGVEVSVEGDSDDPEFYFRSVNIPICYSGGIIIADDFIKELYSHMGYHPAWKYREIIELLFDSGKLTEVRDVSDKAEEYRKKFVNKNDGPRLEDLPKEEYIRRRKAHDVTLDQLLWRDEYVDTGSTEEWIEETFTLEYKL